MDYEEEQSGELEALESIYSEELSIISDVSPRIFTLPIKTSDWDEELNDDGPGMRILLKFTHTPKYPDELPLMEIEEASENLSEDLQNEMLSFLKETLENGSLGMVMIFTAVSEAIEWLGTKYEKIEENKAAVAKLKKEKEEEEERKKLEGTKVTIESFLKWKSQFDEERLVKKEKKANDNNKLNGRELFISNHTLVDSDIKFLEAAGETVTVDESLFEDLDDLDLEDEDDPDWNPGNDSD